jgi:hypothetical protein
LVVVGVNKTPDKIKKELSNCTDKTDCGWCPNLHICELEADALAYIQQLEADKAQLLEKIKQLELERDAAISDMGTLAEHQLNPCDICKHLEPCDKPCERALQMDECFEWRGVCESNGGTP